MKLRARLALTIAVTTLPIVAGLVWTAQSLRRQALLDATYDETVSRMESGGLDRCEALGARFVPDGRPAQRLRRRGMRRGMNRLERRIYDDAFRPLSPQSPPLEPALRRKLESGEEIAALWDDGSSSGVEIAMRMPWDGPCAIVVVGRARGPLALRQDRLRPIVWSAALALLTSAIALLASGPLVRRIRRLTRAVRDQASGNYAGDVEATGTDEIADLARAFNEASHEIRTRFDELGHRDRALTEFLASTTHDVMVPLTVLQGHLSDLRDAVRAQQRVDPSKVAAALEEAHYLASLVRNLAAAARLEAGEPMLTRHRFDLRESIDHVIARHAPIAKERGVELGHAVPEDAVHIVADSTLIEQAIGNLVHNAIRYNHEGGHVAVILEARPDAFVVQVVDDGPGIPEDELARVAERRFRGGAARARQPTGLGLGLHIVRDVAHKHAWSLHFESPPDGGLRVTLEGARDRLPGPRLES